MIIKEFMCKKGEIIMRVQLQSSVLCDAAGCRHSPIFVHFSFSVA